MEITNNNPPATIEEKLLPFWQEAGCAEVIYPVETGAVLAMLQGCDYLATGDDLLGWASAGLIKVPSVSGRRKWDAEHVWAAIAQCEGRRRWKPMSPRHVFKATSAEVAVWQAQLAGAEEPIRDLAGYDVEMLLHLMEQAEQKHVRHVLKLSIQQLLKRDNL